MRAVIEKKQHLTISSVAELELVKAKSAIEQFIYSCSHTMRGPLKSIAGLVYLLKNSEENSDVDPKFYLQSIERTITKLELVLNDLEQFLANSSQDIDTRPVDVKKYVTDVLADFQHVIEKNNINISITGKQSMPLHTDENRFRGILSHLISNAIVYQDLNKEDRQICIHIKVDTSSCTVRIRDTGIGMDNEVMAHMDQLFFRGSGKSPGSGIGLYVTKELLHKMGGKLTANSKSGVGSSFTFTIPNLL